MQLSKDEINDGLDYDHLLVSFDYRTSYEIFIGTLIDFEPDYLIMNSDKLFI